MKVFCFEEENIGEYSREQLLEYLFAYKFYIYPDAKKREHQARCELEAYIPIININKSTLSDPKTASLYYAWVAEDEFLHNALMSISVIRDCLMTKYGEHFESLFDRIVDTSKKMI